MRKTVVSFIAFLFLINVNPSLQAQTPGSAVEYMNDLVSPVTEFKNETWQYLKAVTRGKGARKVESKRQKLINEVGSVRSTVKSKKAYNGDASFKTAIDKYLELTYIVLKQDYDKILNMEEISEQSYDAMEAYLLAQEKASEKMNEASEMFTQAQKDFAAKNDITLTEAEDDKMSEKIKKASKSLKYYNEMYLIFFKSYKQEAYILDAINRNDLNALEQNINSLASITDEQLEKLKEIKAYNGDSNLKAALQKTLTFYKNQAEKSYPIAVDFFVKQDNFTKVQKSFEAKSKKQRTQEDVDIFNKAVNEQNEAVAKYNAMNEASNKERSKNLDSWNKAVEDFFNKHN